MHHLRYWLPDLYDGFRSIYGLESAQDLLHLCRACHDDRHRDCMGTFWRDPEEMSAYWSSMHEAQ